MVPEAPRHRSDNRGDVLELRIHGVNNTTPPAMLDLPAASIDQVEGDDLGSFWRPKESALADLTPTDRGYVPPGVSREAYSWGGMARSSIGGTSTVGKVLGAAGRLGWALLLPFGLVNVAYWARRLDASEPALTGPDADGAASPDTAPGTLVPLTRTQRSGGALVRVAGLVMTLMTATTGSVISLDYLAVQCFSGSVARCSGIPGWAGFLYSWSLPRRLALLSLVPLAVVGFLMYLASRSRSRYERATRDQTYGPAAPQTRTPEASGAHPRWPLLSTPGFWNHSTVTGRTARLHLSAVALLLTVSTAWHMRFGAGPACATVASLLGESCLVQSGRAGPGGSLVVIVATILLFVLVVALVVAHTEDAADVAKTPAAELPTWAARLRSPLALAIGVYGGLGLLVVQTGLLLLDGSTYRPAADAGVRQGFSMVGVSVIPNVLVAILLGLSLTGLTLRYVSGWAPLALGLAFSVTLLASGSDGPLGWISAVVAVVAAGGIVILVTQAQGGTGGPARRYEVWGGCGPGVALALAQLLCIILSSGLVVAVGNILNGTYPAASLAGLAVPPTGQADPCADSCATPPPEFLLSAPRPYVWFGAVLVVALAVLVLAVGAILLLQWRSGRRHPPRPVTPAAEPRDAAESSSGASDSADVMLRGGRLSDPAPDGPLGSAVNRARSLARHAHRAEKGAALVAAVGMVTLGVALYASVGSAPNDDGLFGMLMGLGMWALTAVGGLVVGLATGAGDAVRTRPLGLIWDLMCFLPRAGHPFGPPCYGERVVPELLGRYHWWLSEEGARDESQIADTPRTIVISAHSLGCVLAVATVLGAPDPMVPRSPVPHLRLLTYGCQLRAYFSRFFPELLGPDVLGSPPARAADLTSADPWENERTQGSPIAPAVTGSVRRLLGGTDTDAGRWVNLWRLTDYLGFPVHHYPAAQGGGDDTAFDRYADEIDRTAYLLDVVTHGEYPRAGAYSTALSDLTGPGVAG